MADLHPLHLPLEALYARYNRREFVDPDPLAAVYRFQTPQDQEVAGLIAAAMAFGNVTQILRALEEIFGLFPAPHHALMELPPRAIRARLQHFRYRYITGNQLAALMLGMQALLRKHDSLGLCFAAQIRPEDETVIPALARFVALLETAGGIGVNYLLPNPSRGSACKRLFLYLRWMIRNDDVDLGLWPVSPRLLIVPMDTHMHRMAIALGMTSRKQPGLRTALEVTACFGRITPEDPTRYDFALTRLGIRPELTPQSFLDALPRTAPPQLHARGARE